MTASAAGPGYILNHDGSSFLGTVDGGKYRTLATSGGAASDVPSYIAVGALGVASLDGGLHLSVLGPGGGLKRVLDIVIPAQQLGGQDHFAFWNATTGLYEPSSPIVVNDLQFFTGPIAGDISGDGLAEGIQGSAVSDTVAAGLGIPSAAATRYHTGGWTVSSAGLGDAPLGALEDGQLSLATTTREGYLRVYPTSVAAGSAAACTALSEWPQFGHDARNSGQLSDRRRAAVSAARRRGAGRGARRLRRRVAHRHGRRPRLRQRGELSGAQPARRRRRPGLARRRAAPDDRRRPPRPARARRSRSPGSPRARRRCSCAPTTTPATARR